MYTSQRVERGQVSGSSRNECAECWQVASIGSRSSHCNQACGLQRANGPGARHVKVLGTAQA